MADKNEKYVYESEKEEDVKDRVIVRTFDNPVEERFTLSQLEEQVVNLEQQKTNLDVEIAKVQEKIDEAKVALKIGEEVK